MRTDSAKGREHEVSAPLRKEKRFEEAQKQREHELQVLQMQQAHEMQMSTHQNNGTTTVVQNFRLSYLLHLRTRLGYRVTVC